MPNIPTVAPVLETARLILRPHALADFDAYAEMWADPTVTRFIGGRPRTREESWIRFLRHPGMWSLLGFGFWAVEEKATGRFVGEAGFHDLKRDMVPSIEGLPEAGWALIPDTHGKGYATEIMRHAVSWGEGQFGEARMVCIIDPANSGSIRVAEKCGFRELMLTTYHGDDTILFERVSPA